MIQVKRQNSFSRILTLAAVVLLTLSSSLFAQDAPAADAKAGEALFKANCAACHKLYKPMTGPLLHQVSEKYDREWLYKWIKNSQGLIKSGDPLAVKVYEENGNKVMNSFPALSNADIDNILAYTDTPKPKAPEVTAVVGGADGNQGGGVSNNLILAILGFVLLLLVAVLFLVNNTLNKFASAQGIEMPVAEKRKPIWKAFVENQFLVLVSVIFLLLGSAYFAYGWMSQVGVDQGYMPVQPIHYSHRIHAGENAIECKYCHSSARVSKHSGIPSLNVCMNCHKSIAEVAGPESEFSSVTEDYSKEFYDKEIQKLYKAVGWDEATQSYTGETQAVEWVRIHNLPDFAYFNHSQHVSVAGIECQKCHGPVEEMEIMYQHAPLTMGWCINCHRETNVKIEGNAYYEEIHEQLAKKYGVEKVTAAQMGGLECGKCHY
ncbi:c-type cytochrome [Dokdonia donghaensis]|uniref:Cytochrome C n=1 Tax=Dokdonia donghaensis DSW-1 TaxID=1300343 RepID=A0A0A2GVI5_9FLAO|nr:c-type cytochrome [Dokdonia donghaensis]ANH59966.1 Cytochrome c6 [Dokdonia donghaensis DSW-1]KGO07279.1 cytochrome C [Dokdonia donghaensis DSW-1]